MSKLQQSDLILAGRYVDGELPAHEIAAAESRIASDPDFSAAVDRIREQSDAFKLLPSFKPSDDLADRTLSASLDQVKAIMGAWPTEQDDDAKTTPSRELSAPVSDWKSTAALIASLAGVIMFGMILWQNNNPAQDPGVAMTASSADIAPVFESEKDGPFDGLNPKSATDALEKAMKRAPESVATKGGAANDSPLQSVAREQGSAGIGGGGFSGTPMRQTNANSAKQSNELQIAINDPVSQVWCVNQDSSMPKNAVCDILQSNQINVQLDRQNAIQSDSVQAYYVAATPGQMKLALSEISNNADIEMFELPQGSGSPIADVIQQQFTQSGRDQPKVEETEIVVSPDMPLRFTPLKNNALAQQLPLNSLTRSTPLADPPPILNSDSLKEKLSKSTTENSNDPESALAQNTKPAAPLPAEVDSARQRTPVKSDNEKAVSSSADNNVGQLDKFLDESDQQLRKYLIFILANEKQRSER